MIIFDPNYIITAPQSLNLGGLADLIACSSAISDWILSYEKNKERISKKGCQLFKQFIHDLIKNVDKLIPFTIESTQYIYNKFLEALALCGASLSDRPLEGAEHFLYYLIDELSPRPWNHGQVIAFTSLICLYLHKKTAFFSLNEIKSLYERIGINYRMSDLQITPDLLRKALLKINKYVIENKKHYSIWNEINFETQGDILNEVIEFAENI
jgi:glycerol dehydrogenase-like iron-containing ADH family enzyme